MQRIALSWFVLQLTHGRLARGRDHGRRAVPSRSPLFGLFGGVITDRLDARRLVLGTQVAQLVTAVALAWIALGGFAQPWMLYTIAFLNGMILVLDVPSRQQLTYRMVGRETLPNAIALNSSLFNASRIFGPSLAGVILGFAGVGVCFTVNAISFLAVLLSLLAMRTSEFFPVERFERPQILRGTREGLSYVRKQPRMRIVLVLTLVLGHVLLQLQRDAAGARVHDAAHACVRVRHSLGRLRRAARSRARSSPPRADARRRR